MRQSDLPNVDAQQLIPGRRLIAAFAVAPLVPVLLNGLLFWPVFVIAMIVGIACAYGLTLAVAVPLVRSLTHRGKLTPVAVALAAAFLTAIPDTAVSFVAMLYGGMNMMNEYGIWLVYEGRVTLAGYIYYFVIRPLVYGLMGAAGGLVFWLMAVGRQRTLPSVAT